MNSLRRLCDKTETEAAARGTRLRCRFDLEGTPVELAAIRLPLAAGPARNER